MALFVGRVIGNSKTGVAAVAEFDKEKPPEAAALNEAGRVGNSRPRRRAQRSKRRDSNVRNRERDFDDRIRASQTLILLHRLDAGYGSADDQTLSAHAAR